MLGEDVMVDSSEVFYGSNFIDFSLIFLFSDLYIHQHLKGQTKYVLKLIKIIKMKKKQFHTNHPASFC